MQIKDFAGNIVDMEELENRYNVGMVPAMVFVDHQSRELTKRIIGVYTLEMFGGEVDEAIIQDNTAQLFSGHLHNFMVDPDGFTNFGCAPTFH